MIRSTRLLAKAVDTEGRYLYGSGQPNTTGAFPLLPPCQVTDSWRTRGPASDSVEIDPNDLAVIRNGFTTNDSAHDRGHPFSTTKTSDWVSHLDAYVLLQNRYGTAGWYRGPLLPDFRGLVPQERLANGYFGPRRDPYPAMPSTSEDSVLGSKAISATIPTSPHANLATTVGETFKDGIPALIGSTLWKDQISLARKSGGEFLNVQFGWVPLISDIRKIVESLRSASSIVQQFQRDSGRQVRRRFTFPTSVNSSLSEHYAPDGPYMWLGRTSFTGNDVSTVSKTIRTERTVRFSGAYTYLAPDPEGDLMDRFMAYEQKANVLFGTRVTPEVLWNLAPWSWLVDWFADIGTLLGNASQLSADGLVIRYGYLMVHDREEHFYQTLPDVVNRRTGKQMPVVTTSFRRETKRRVQATPYGFGLTWDGFSPMQLAILAALGLTRAR